MLAAGYVQVWSSIGAWRHALPLVAASLVRPLLIALTTMVFAVGEAKLRTEEQNWQASLWRLRMKHQAGAEKRAQRPAPIEPGTPLGAGVPKPLQRP